MSNPVVRSPDGYIKMTQKLNVRSLTSSTWKPNPSQRPFPDGTPFPRFTRTPPYPPAEKTLLSKGANFSLSLFEILLAEYVAQIGCACGDLLPNLPSQISRKRNGRLLDPFKKQSKTNPLGFFGVRAGKR